MEGVVSLLGGDGEALVRRTWATLEHELGIRAHYPGALPHLSFHVAESYDVARATAAVSRLSGAHRPLEAAVSGFGVFPGAVPVIYLAVVPSAALLALQQAAFDLVAGASRGPSPFYAPGRWVPHITIAERNVPPALLPAALARLAAMPLAASFMLDNLAFGRDTEAGVEVLARAAVQ